MMFYFGQVHKKGVGVSSSYNRAPKLVSRAFPLDSKIYKMSPMSGAESPSCRPGSVQLNL